MENKKNRNQLSSEDSIEMQLINAQKKPLIVVDIGCRWGFADRFLLIDQRDKFRIFGFDPDREECIRLMESYSNLPDNLITFIPFGLAGTKGKRTLHITTEPACSSLHKPIKFLSDNYPTLECIKKERDVLVDVITLKDWATENGINQIDYIKIDTQGTELEILEGAGDLLQTARCIDIEVEFNPIYEGQTLFGETDFFLREKGFVLWRLSNLVHYSMGGKSLPLSEPITICFDTQHRQEIQSYGGQLFWADATYIHSDVLKRSQSETHLNKRDVILFSTLGMHDVVIHIKRLGNI